MRIFVLEYVTAGGWREIDAGPSLRAEGAMMTRALVRDLAALSGVEVVVARDPVLGPAAPGAIGHDVDPADLWGSWRRIAAGCDAVWPIAPESDGLLEEVTRLAAAQGAFVLNSGGVALAIARSKRATARMLADAGVKVAPTLPLAEAPPPALAGWVVKPDDGAGAADTWRVTDRAALERRRAAADTTRLVVQPFIRGAALSLSLLARDGQAWLLSCNRQEVTLRGDAFHYRGSLVGGAEDRRTVLAPLAERVAAALPELWGYVGIDLVDGPDGPVVLEVNPRLTTSYVGLVESIGVNPAGLVLQLRDHAIAELRRPLAPRAVAVMVPAS